MTRQPSLDPRLFVDYLAGACTLAESAEVERWAAADPQRGKVLDDLRTMWIAIPNRTKPSVDLDVFVHRVEARIAAETESQYNSRVVRPSAPRRIWYATAGLALGIMALLIGWKHNMLHLGPRVSVAMATYTTTNRERANITLMDGTTVALDVASRLDVPADYPAGNHTLRLTGEALFTVTHHTGTPFTVLTGSARTQVLGTSFIVRHYASDPITTVVVRDGKVAVAVRSTAVPPMVVTAAQQAEITQTGQIHVQSADPGQFAFATGLLKLDRVLLPAAIPELNRWYDIDIRLGAATLASQRVTGEFAAGSVADLSDILSLMFNVRVVRDGRIITLYPR